ncbi:acyl-CoA thioesterase II [Pseudooceanicola sp. 216_PA32_1]|uniref:Acyl-CoA thioesterase 2 n=1 Tax=Pseudooceanicola pacificus TaxID=2676438 RepID=A0A844WCH0_9RHOB|nr:acyl-CoA thioesterase II [Pseudooceanicola pacificus]MWB77892.1 acyl-CoA thioesterase II [Pseudooceanicola pacificus]
MSTANRAPAGDDHNRAPAGDDQLTPILDVERVEDNFFLGIATPEGRGRSFGGQVIAQALAAAVRTVDADRPPHSLHAYFMRPGDATKPVLYRIERDRDGGSFATRRVVAIQHGQPILNMAASFHVEEAGLHHQSDMPDVPGPDGLRNEQELAEAFEDKVPRAYRNFLKMKRPIEVRPCEERPPYFDTGPMERQAVWIRTRTAMPDDTLLHRVALAYASDLGLLGASLTRHGISFATRDMMIASLDHAIWLHGDFRMDEWLLYDMDSTWTGGARGFCRGRIFTREGRLVANVAQEGLIRQTTPKES